MALNYQNSDPVVLGSGELYLMINDGITAIDYENLEPFEEDFLVNIGAIESGATIEIGEETTEIRSANRGLIRKITVDKNIRFNTGVMTWVMKNVSKFLLGSTYEEIKDDPIETNRITKKKMKVNFKDKKPVVYLRFVHKKEDGGELIINIYKAQFDGNLTFTFDKESPTTFNYDFVALSNENNNYIEIVETFPAN
ncbi:hypothetical protein [Schinkia azotoformans]|uniref:hypothetical protein n=1 Tax=Schinkia azotoformans TaxID=1454 RepID=UPI002DB9846B|nr:hypothetical protein [Schinkia azotoformans]MEC1780076.1 hypothetical protein [Schinkia azotoformans]MED4330845.1 hypothetical protein [Schinkia azotoformans]